jgi:hypothetical protein
MVERRKVGKFHERIPQFTLSFSARRAMPLCGKPRSGTLLAN